MSSLRNIAVFIGSLVVLLKLPVFSQAKSAGCPEGLYGVLCERRCNPGCRAGCDQQTGHCWHGCGEGWTGENCIKPCPDHRYGPNCVHTCGHCKDDEPCAPATGICQHGCERGLRGQKCDKGCEANTYGAGCIYKCGHCRQHQKCNTVTGVCAGGCEPGWYGAKCDTACQDGTYGGNCQHKCGLCADNGTCDHVTGTCTGGCQPGWRGTLCNDRCVAGRFGVDCEGSCGRCLKGTCDHVTGVCDHGCARGWMGDLCQEECTHGLYGTNCSMSCGHCLNDAPCDVVNGICSHGCAPGWKGVFCTMECAPGFHGADCQYRCGRCKDEATCMPASGRCPGDCEEGWAGAACDQGVVSDNGPLHIESMLPAVVVVTVVVVVVSAVAALYLLVIRPRSKPARLNRLYTEGEECGDPIRNAYEQMAGGPWDLPRSSLILTTQQLGNGQFGQVKKGFVRLRGVKVPVAIKSLKENASEKDKRDFLNELAILKQVGKHPNVVCLVGACHIRGVMYVAMEYAKHGDLRTFLRKSRKLRQHEYGNCAGATPYVGKTMLLRLALHAAEGLRHLADKQIIHRDVAARNVLLGERLVAKIADFGLSKNDETYVKTSSTRVPIRWMAVESLFNNTYTTQSDV